MVLRRFDDKFCLNIADTGELSFPPVTWMTILLVPRNDSLHLHFPVIGYVELTQDSIINGDSAMIESAMRRHDEELARYAKITPLQNANGDRFLADPAPAELRQLYEAGSALM